MPDEDELVWLSKENDLYDQVSWHLLLYPSHWQHDAPITKKKKKKFKAAKQLLETVWENGFAVRIAEVEYLGRGWKRGCKT